MKDINEIKDFLKENDLRVTQSRLAVYSVLLNSHEKLLTPEEIFNQIENTKSLKCDLVSVYRLYLLLKI